MKGCVLVPGTAMSEGTQQRSTADVADAKQMSVYLDERMKSPPVAEAQMY